MASECIHISKFSGIVPYTVHLRHLLFHSYTWHLLEGQDYVDHVGLGVEMGYIITNI